jgi:hypothetical protein
MRDDIERIAEIKSIAEKNRWREIDFQKENRMISFRRFDVRVNVWYTKMTVATCLFHSKHGKSQLFRKGVTMPELEKIFVNPRVHTGKGYFGARLPRFYGSKQQMPEWNMAQELQKKVDEDPRAVIDQEGNIHSPVDNQSPVEDFKARITKAAEWSRYESMIRFKAIRFWNSMIQCMIERLQRMIID